MLLAKRCAEILSVAEQEIKSVKAGDSGTASHSVDD
jgi:hypothetical protein